MSSLNLCQFIGNIGKIETRFLSNGDAVTNCSLAVNETWKDQNGDKQERCEWVNVTAYKKLAEIMSEFCQKGMQVYVSGRMQTRKYTDKNGVERYSTDIIANDMKMLGSKQGNSEKSESFENNPSTANDRAKARPSNAGGFDDDSDSIPF